MDNLTPEQRRRNMQVIKGKGSKIEVLFAKALWQKGLRYRKNDTTVYGKPDLTFKKYKIAIFVDSEYFHGKDWEVQKHNIKTNRVFWWAKIERNIVRDSQVNEFLLTSGWTVFRFWGKEITKDLSTCISIVIEAIRSKES